MKSINQEQSAQNQNNQQNFNHQLLQSDLNLALTEAQVKQMKLIFNDQSMSLLKLQQLIQKYPKYMQEINLNLNNNQQVQKDLFIFRRMKHCSAKVFIIRQKKFQFQFQYFFLKQISHVEFSNLLELNLNGNNIQNIESLFIYVPNYNCQKLQKVFLQNNKIYNLKSFQKTKFNKIKTLSLNANPIIYMNHLTRMKITEQKYFSLNLDNCLTQYNINPIFKSQIRCLSDYVDFQQAQIQDYLPKPTKQQMQKIIKMNIKRFVQKPINIKCSENQQNQQNQLMNQNYQ